MESASEIDSFMDKIEDELRTQFRKELNSATSNVLETHFHEVDDSEFALEDIEILDLNKSEEDIDLMKYFIPEEPVKQEDGQTPQFNIVNSNNGKSYVVLKTIENIKPKPLLVETNKSGDSDEESLKQDETPRASMSPRPNKSARRALFNEKEGCGICFPDIFYSKQRKVNRRQKYFVCELCNTAYGTKQRIRQHEKESHKKGSIPCLVEDCYKKFATRRGRDDHIINEPHTNYTCDCGKIFKKKFNLKKHKKHCNKK